MSGTPGPPDYDNIRLGGPEGLRYPLESAPATFKLKLEVDINAGTQGVSNNYNLPATQVLASYYTVTNASAGFSVTWPGSFPGHTFVVYNNSGQTVTFLVKSQTGVAVATGKRAVLVIDKVLGDVARVTADT